MEPISLAKPKSVSFNTPSGPVFVYNKFSGCKIEKNLDKNKNWRNFQKEIFTMNMVKSQISFSILVAPSAGTDFRRRHLASKVDRRQILTSKIGPCTKSIKKF